MASGISKYAKSVAKSAKNTFSDGAGRFFGGFMKGFLIYFVSLQPKLNTIVLLLKTRIT